MLDCANRNGGAGLHNATAAGRGHVNGGVAQVIEERFRNIIPKSGNITEHAEGLAEVKISASLLRRSEDERVPDRRYGVSGRMYVLGLGTTVKASFERGRRIKEIRAVQ